MRTAGQRVVARQTSAVLKRQRPESHRLAVAGMTIHHRTSAGQDQGLVVIKIAERKDAGGQIDRPIENALSVQVDDTRRDLDPRIVVVEGQAIAEVRQQNGPLGDLDVVETDIRARSRQSRQQRIAAEGIFLGMVFEETSDIVGQHRILAVDGRNAVRTEGQERREAVDEQIALMGDRARRVVRIVTAEQCPAGKTALGDAGDVGRIDQETAVVEADGLAVVQIGEVACRGQDRIAAAVDSDRAGLRDRHVADRQDRDIAVRCRDRAVDGQTAGSVVDCDPAIGRDIAQRVDGVVIAHHDDVAVGAQGQYADIDEAAVLDDRAAGDQGQVAAAGGDVTADQRGQRMQHQVIAGDRPVHPADDVTGMVQQDLPCGSDAELVGQDRAGLADAAGDRMQVKSAGFRDVDDHVSGLLAHLHLRAVQHQAAEAVAFVGQVDETAARDRTVLGREAGLAGDGQGRAVLLADTGLLVGPFDDLGCDRGDAELAAEAVAGVGERDRLTVGDLAVEGEFAGLADHREIAVDVLIAEFDDADLADDVVAVDRDEAGDDIAEAVEDDAAAAGRVECPGDLQGRVGGLGDVAAVAVEIEVPSNQAVAEHGVSVVDDTDVTGQMGRDQGHVAADRQRRRLADDAIGGQRQVLIDGQRADDGDSAVGGCIQRAAQRTGAEVQRDIGDDRRIAAGQAQRAEAVLLGGQQDIVAVRAQGHVDAGQIPGHAFELKDIRTVTQIHGGGAGLYIDFREQIVGMTEIDDTPHRLQEELPRLDRLGLNDVLAIQTDQKVGAAERGIDMDIADDMGRPVQCAQPEAGVGADPGEFVGADIHRACAVGAEGNAVDGARIDQDGAVTGIDRAVALHVEIRREDQQIFGAGGRRQRDAVQQDQCAGSVAVVVRDQIGGLGVIPGRSDGQVVVRHQRVIAVHRNPAGGDVVAGQQYPV